MNVSKKELCSRVATKMNLSPTLVSDVVQEFLDGVVHTLSSGNDCEFRDFGIFRVVTRKEKKGRNPRTGDEIVIPEHKTVKFRIGRILRNRFPNV